MRQFEIANQRLLFDIARAKSVELEFNYDATGKLSEKNTTTFETDSSNNFGSELGSKTEFFVYDGEKLIAAADDQGKVTHSYLRDPTNSELLSVDTYGNTPAVAFVYSSYQGAVSDLYVISNNTTVETHRVSHTEYNVPTAGPKVWEIISEVEPGSTYDSLLNLNFSYGRVHNSATERFFTSRDAAVVEGNHRYGGPASIARTGLGTTDSRYGARDPDSFSSIFWSEYKKSGAVNRAMGIARVAGGLLELGTAAGACVVSWGLACIPAGAVAVIAVDDLQAGFRQIYSGEEVDSWRYQAVESLTGSKWAAFGVDLSTAILPSVVLSRAVSSSAKLINSTDELVDAANGLRNIDEIVEGSDARHYSDLLTCSSFVPDTLVLMADGTTRSIQDVKLGDWVLATDPETGEQGPRQVTDLIFSEGEKELVEILIDGEIVTATDEHPFWVVNENNWFNAEDLRV
ncbi:MAG: hypothetical protein ACI9HK_004078 [Pirellulaceae bacterium]|jgi:hypothetical protein